MNHDNHGLDLVQTGLYSNCHALCSVFGCYLELCDFWTLVKGSLAILFFIKITHLSVWFQVMNHGEKCLNIKHRANTMSALHKGNY